MGPFTRLIANQMNTLYAGSIDPIKDQITFTERTMEQKYQGRKTSIYYMYSTWAQNLAGEGKNTTFYLFSKSVKPMENTFKDTIGLRDVTSFRLIDESDYSDADEELKLVQICKKAIQSYDSNPMNPNPTVVHEIVTSGKCRSGWTELYRGYTFLETNDEKLPYDTFKAIINTRTSYPGDSYITELSGSADLDQARVGYAHYNTHLTFITADQNALRKYLVKSEVRSKEMQVTWKPIAGATRYAVQIYKRDTPLDGFERPRYTASNDFDFKGLTPDDSYTIKVMPMKDRDAMAVHQMEIPLRTAPSAPKINVKKIRSTSIDVDWVRDETMERYIIDIVQIPDPMMSGMRDLAENLETRVFQTMPDSWYKITLIGVIDEKNNIRTDASEEIVHTAPAPPEVYFKALPDGKAKVGFNTLGAKTNDYFFSITPTLPGVKEGSFISSQEWIVSPNRNTRYSLKLVTKRKAGLMTESAMESIQEPDVVELNRVYSLCQWTSKLQKLNCKPKRIGLEQQDGFEWMFNDANGKLITFEEEIAPREVRILHVAENMFENVEFVNELLSKMINIKTLNLSDNLISTVDSDFLKNTKQLVNLNFAKNHLYEVPDDFFEKVEKQNVVSVSFAENPLTTCGVTRGLINGLTNLAKLDLHDAGQLKSTSRGVLVGEKINSNLNIYCKERA